MDQLFPVTGFCKKVVFAYTNTTSLPKHINYSEIAFWLSFLVKVEEYNHFSVQTNTVILPITETWNVFESVPNSLVAWHV